MKNIFSFFSRLFKNFKKLAEKYVHPAVIITQALRNAVESPVADIITAIIPGTLDDKIVYQARIQLPKILKILRISEECLQLEKFEDVVECAIKKLREYTPEGQAAQYHNIASMLSVYLSDRKISWREALHLSEEVFQSTKK